MTRIGIVNIDTSHPMGFGKVFAENDLGMKYDMIYNDSFRGDGEVDAFISKNGLSGRASSLQELAEKTDIGFIQSCDWSKHIEYAMPFIERGKPVFIDKPLVGSVRDIARVRELVANGAEIVGFSSSVRLAEEVCGFLSTPVEERGEVVAIYATSGVDEFNYGIHVSEVITEIAGAPGVACQYIGSAKNADGVCEIYNAQFANGVLATYYTYLTGWRPFHVSIMTTKGHFDFTIDTAKIYKALLMKISEMLKRGDRLTDGIEKVLNASEIMLCGKRSRDFENGALVRISDLRDDDAFDGPAFFDFYSKAASVMYK